MKNGHIYAKNNENKYDVIISQGGTSEAIKKMVNIPIVSVEIRTVDFVNALYNTKQYGNKIGLVTYESEDLKDLESLEDKLGIDFNIFPYTTKEGLKKQVDDATAIGKLTLVGMGDCIMDTAKEKI